MNIANRLTLLRILIIPIFIVVFYMGYDYLALILFVFACITDWLDGYLARKNNIVTNMGKFLDPLADKVLVASALIMLVEKYRIPAWISIIIIAREFIVTGVRLVASEKGKVISASVLGKIKTVTQMFAIGLGIIDTYAFMSIFWGTDVYELKQEMAINILSSAFFVIAITFTIISGIQYIWQSRDVFKN